MKSLEHGVRVCLHGEEDRLAAGPFRPSGSAEASAEIDPLVRREVGPSAFPRSPRRRWGRSVWSRLTPRDPVSEAEARNGPFDSARGEPRPRSAGQNPRVEVLAACAAALCLAACAATRPAAPPRDEHTRAAELAEAEKLYVEIDVHFEKGEYAVALPMAQRCLALRERWLPAKDLTLADTLDSMGLALELAGQLREAQPYFERVVALRRELLGEDAEPVASALRRQGIVYFELEQPKAALEVMQRARRILEKLHGPDSREVASVLADIGAAQWALGDLAGARASFEAKLERDGAAAATRSHLTTLQNLGEVLVEQGDVTRARQVLEASLRDEEKLLGAEHPSLAFPLNTYGELLTGIGELGAAQAALERALAIREKALGPDHPLVATSLLNLGRVRWALGDLAAARELFKRALAIDERVHGPDSPALAATLANLAGLEVRVGNLDAALAQFRRALWLAEKGLGADSRDALWLRALIADVELRLGHRAEARALLDRAVAGAERAGAHGALLTMALAQRGELLFQEGQRAEGIAQVARAVELMQQSQPADGPDLAAARAKLGMYENALGHSARARALLEQALGAIGRWLDRSADHVPQQREADFFGGFQEYLADVLAIGWSPEEAWSQVLRFQGSAALVASARRLETWAREDRAPGVEAGLRDLGAVRAAIARLQRAGGEKERRALAELEAREAALAASLAKDSAGYRERATLQAAGPDEVCRGLPLDAVLVDYVASSPEQLTPVRPAGRLSAFVVRHEGLGCLVRRVDLPASLDEVVALASAWRAAAESDATGLTHRRGDRLRAAVFDPLAPLLDRPLVFVVPDGPLAMVALGALPEAGSSVGAQRFLLERWAFAYLGSAKDLLRSAPAAPGGAQPPLVIGGLEFGSAPAGAAPTSEDRSAGGSTACDVGDFPPLRGAGLEAETVARRLGKTAVLLRGAAGTERAVREQARHRSVLHLATHGFFLGECAAEARRRVSRVDPMQVSGLALAGASAHAGRPLEDDGLFTAAEFATLDLRGTRLVVLSGCDTGRGGVVLGQGVQGLQRAVLTAGVPSLVMSLWKIPDDDTRALMDGFYAGVAAGLAPREALRRAQLEALARQREQGAGDAVGRFAAFISAGLE